MLFLSQVGAFIAVLEDSIPATFPITQDFYIYIYICFFLSHFI